MKPIKLTVCDVNIQRKGHYIGYNQYIIDNVSRLIKLLSYDVQVTFIFNSEAKELLTFPEGTKVEFLTFPNEWRSSLKGRYKIWNTLMITTRNFEIDELIFMDFDQYQLPIATSKTIYKISGIYFRPHHRIVASNSLLKSKLSAAIRRTKKILVEKLLLMNKSIKNIFILNDPSGVTTLNSFHNTTKFALLPDPIFDYFEVIDLENKTERDEISFLLFGALTERKNITNIIKAFSLAKFKVKTVLKIIGPCDSDIYYNYLNKLINDTLPVAGVISKRIIIQREFVSDIEMEKCHTFNDISLLIYKDFFGSSGLLGRSAKHNMYVIAPSVGLLNEMVNQYNLGATVDPSNVGAISSAMERAEGEYKTWDKNGFERYYQEHQPDEFLQILLKI